LKQLLLGAGAEEPLVPPGLTAGGGLKHGSARLLLEVNGVPPGLTAGGGLKQQYSAAVYMRPAFPPASPPGAD